MTSLFHAARPKQWLKNVLVFAAPAAAGVVFQRDVLVRLVLTFVAFALASSTVYLINDVMDVQADRRHPRKRHRPIAAGLVSLPTALGVAGVLGLVSVAIGLLTQPAVAALILVYLSISAAYSAGVKNVAVVELVAVASGFVLRAITGAAAAEVPVSQLFITVMAFGALAMAAGKRSSELSRSEVRGGSRPVLTHYTHGFLVQVQTMSLGGAILAYALWAFDLTQHSDSFAAFSVEVSIVPLAVALLRYFLMASRGEAEAPEDAVFADAVIGGAGLVWLLLFIAGVAL